MAARIPLLEQELPWSEARIAKALVHSQLFQRKLLIVPRCHFTGPEADLLAVHTPSLRLIDVEIKISRADLLADPKKDKWWTSKWEPIDPTNPASPHRKVEERSPRDWPPKIWKHYYAMPAPIWRKGRAALEPKLPPASGVILLGPSHSGALTAWLARRAKPNKTAPSIQAADVMNLARLAGLRMWDALEKLEARE